MMQIHKTQNLSALAQQQLSTNSVSSKEFRFKKNQEWQTCLRDYGSCNVTFGKGKKPSSSDIKDIKRRIKNLAGNIKVGDIKAKATPEVNKGDKFLNSKTFDTMLSLAENEPVIQAAMSALICIGLRPLTIMALPTKKDKQDNMYAASHSICSGVMGLVSALIIAQPFKSSSRYMMKNMYENLKEDTLMRLNPHLDLASIKDAQGNRKPIEEWLDKAGNKFSKEFKDVEKIPMFKAFNDISAESFKVFGAENIDWAVQKGKSFNEVVDRDGRYLYDLIDWKKVGIVVEQDGMGDARILIRDLDKEFFSNVIKNAEKDSKWSKLDIASVFDGNTIKDFREWKDIDGSQWKLDLDSSYISSAYDTADYIPRISGRTRTEANGTTKYVTYFKNGKNGALGTEITQDLIEADKRNEVHDKILTWLPDILSRPLVASGTIALIPIVLKNIFHLEKSKKPMENNSEAKALKHEPANKQTEVVFKGRNSSDSESVESSNTAFKGGKANKPSLFEKLIAIPLAKAYALPLYESERTSRISEKLSKIPGKMTSHMATLGSLLTSSVYMQQTLTKKDLEPDRRRTLAINQGLCFIIPTICAYTVDRYLNNWIKKNEYRYSGLQEQKIAKAKLEGKNQEYIKNLETSLGKKLKGVRILATLATFSLIYRYLTPVGITPIANKIGDNINEKRKQKEQHKQPIVVDLQSKHTDNQAKVALKA